MMKKTLSPKNTQRILNLIAHHEPITQPSLADMSELTRSAVNRHISYLKANGLISHEGQSESSVGRPAHQIRLDRKGNATFGLSFVEESICASVANFDDELLGHESRVVPFDLSQEALIAIFDEVAGSVLSQARDRGVKIRMGVVGCAARLDAESGRVLYSAHFPALKDFDFKKFFSERFNLYVEPMFYDHANFCGEKESDLPGVRLGLLHWGMGISYTQAIGRDLDFVSTFSGARPTGHLRVSKEGRLCSCGRRGCLEAEYGLCGILASLKERHAEFADLTVDGLLEQARKGNAEIGRYIAYCAEQVASYLSPMLHMCNPHVVRIVSLFGFDRQGILEAFRRGFKASLHQDQYEKTRIEVVDEPQSISVLGACRLARFIYMKPSLVAKLRVAVEPVISSLEARSADSMVRRSDPSAVVVTG